MGEQARDDFPPEELLNSFACLDPSSIQEMEGGQVVNLDYQELCSYPSTTSLPTMAESLTDYISYYSKMEIVNSCGIDLSKPTQQSVGDLVEHPQTDSIDFNDNDVSQNKEIISSSLRNIQDAIVTRNISPSSRGLIEKSLHILKTAIAIGSHEEEELVNLTRELAGNDLDGLEAVGGLPASALAVNEEEVREALGLHKVGAGHKMSSMRGCKVTLILCNFK